MVQITTATAFWYGSNTWVAAAYAGTLVVATVDDSTYTPAAAMANASFPPGQAPNCTVAVAVGQDSTRSTCGFAVFAAACFISVATPLAPTDESDESKEVAGAAAEAGWLELSLHAVSMANSPGSAVFSAPRRRMARVDSRCEPRFLDIMLLRLPLVVARLSIIRCSTLVLFQITPAAWRCRMPSSRRACRCWGNARCR